MLTWCITGCTPQLNIAQDWPNNSATPLPLTAQQYLRNADVDNENDRQNNLSFAAIKASNEAEIAAAKAIIKQRMPQNTSPASQAIRHLSKAHVYHFLHRQRAARELKLAQQNLPASLQILWYQLAAEIALRANNPTQAVVQLQHAYPLIPSEHQLNWVANHWQYLLAAAAIKPLPPLSANNNLASWHSLAKLSQTALNQPEQWPNLKTSWLNHHDNQQAATLLKGSTTDWPTIEHLNHIGIILPLHGLFAKQANSLLQGMMSSLYQYNHEHPAQPLTVDVFDSSTHDEEQLISFAQQQQLKLILGPLLKKNVASLNNNRDITTPILAFNPAPEQQARPNIFWMDLTQETEFIQLAYRIHQLGYSHPLVLIQNSPFGKRLANVFQQTWDQHHAGSAIEVLLPIDNKQNKVTMRTALGITESLSHGTKLKQMLPGKLNTQPSHRTDVDHIILIMNHTKAQQIIPLIQYFYANDLPIFGSSILQRNNPIDYQNQDFEHVRYLDSPSQVSRFRIPEPTMPKWPKYLKNYATFYRLGLDALNLAIRIPILNELPLAEYQGKSGQFMMRTPHRITLEKSWLRVRNGRPALAHQA